MTSNTSNTLSKEVQIAKPNGDLPPSASVIAQLASKQEARPYFLRALLIGQSGTGKSLSATTAPGKILFLDFDGRAESLSAFPNVEPITIAEPDPLSPTAWETSKKILLQIKSELASGVFPYDSIVGDGITMMGRYALNWALLLDPRRGLGGGAAMHHYLPQMNELSKFILTSLSLPVHMIYTAHFDYIEDIIDESYTLAPKITGKLRTELPGWFNETYLCHKQQKGKDLQFLWTTTGTGKYQFCKSALNSAYSLQVNLNKSPAGFEKLLQGSRTRDKAAAPKT